MLILACFSPHGLSSIDHSSAQCFVSAMVPALLLPHHASLGPYFPLLSLFPRTLLLIFLLKGKETKCPCLRSLTGSPRDAIWILSYGRDHSFNLQMLVFSLRFTEKHHTIGGNLSTPLQPQSDCFIWLTMYVWHRFYNGFFLGHRVQTTHFTLQFYFCFCPPHHHPAKVSKHSVHSWNLDIDILWCILYSHNF